MTGQDIPELTLEKLSIDALFEPRRFIVEDSWIDAFERLFVKEEIS